MATLGVSQAGKSCVVRVDYKSAVGLPHSAMEPRLRFFPADDKTRWADGHVARQKSQSNRRLSL